jgi:hypothetical protein
MSELERECVYCECLREREGGMWGGGGDEPISECESMGGVSVGVCVYMYVLVSLSVPLVYFLMHTLSCSRAGTLRGLEDDGIVIPADVTSVPTRAFALEQEDVRGGSDNAVGVHW